jgi:hypothetical protein
MNRSTLNFNISSFKLINSAFAAAEPEAAVPNVRGVLLSTPIICMALPAAAAPLLTAKEREEFPRADAI